MPMNEMRRNDAKSVIQKSVPKKVISRKAPKEKVLSFPSSVNCQLSSFFRQPSSDNCQLSSIFRHLTSEKSIQLQHC